MRPYSLSQPRFRSSCKLPCSAGRRDVTNSSLMSLEDGRQLGITGKRVNSARNVTAAWVASKPPIGKADRQVGPKRRRCQTCGRHRLDHHVRPGLAYEAERDVERRLIGGPRRMKTRGQSRRSPACSVNSRIGGPGACLSGSNAWPRSGRAIPASYKVHTSTRKPAGRTRHDYRNGF